MTVIFGRKLSWWDVIKRGGTLSFSNYVIPTGARKQTETKIVIPTGAQRSKQNNSVIPTGVSEASGVEEPAFRRLMETFRGKNELWLGQP
jgi:hypothetical protein